MAVTKAISANPVVHNASTILGGGNVPSTNTGTNVLSIMNSTPITKYASVVADITGVDKALSAGVFANNNRAGKFIVPGLTGQALAGQAVSGLGILTVANDGIKNPIHRFKTYQRIHLTGYNVLTGAATYGGSRGTSIDMVGINGTNGINADQAAMPTDSVPGELVYMVTGATPTQADYPARKAT